MTNAGPLEAGIKRDTAQREETQKWNPQEFTGDIS